MSGGTDGLSFSGDGQTPLQPEDLDGLLPGWVTTRGDLDEVEQRNIATARHRWLQTRASNLDVLLDDGALRALHADMFGDVWRWAGHYRPRETSLGIEPTRIPGEVRKLCGDVASWLQHAEEPRAIREGLARFHHRLVSIHPFRNGNGRHARLATDLLARAVDEPIPVWGAHVPESERVDAYLDALRAADRDPDELGPLMAFMWP